MLGAGCLCFMLSALFLMVICSMRPICLTDKFKPGPLTACSDHEASGSVLSGHKIFEEPAWGTSENDDLDSLWGFNATASSSSRVTDCYFFPFGVECLR